MQHNTRKQQIENMRRLNQAWNRQQNDWFFDKWENDFDRHVKRGMKTVIIAWAIGAIASLITFGVIIWAIISLVNWIISQ